jgi:protein-L-isoaspartate(D-aspartate) O-methyltransferase
MNDLSSARRQYADLIRQAAGLQSDRLVRALAQVPRENFLGQGPWKILRPPNVWNYEDTPDDDPVHIYQDVLVALDPDRHLNNGQPSGLAKWIDPLDLREGECVLHAGCGTGYYTAIMACVVGERGHVIAIEVDSELAARARTNLLPYPWVEVIDGDAAGYDCGKVDRILINAGATHPLPLWLDSLKPQGKLVFPLIRWPAGSKLGEGPAGWGVMLRVQRLEGGYGAGLLSPVAIFPCLGAVDPEADRLVAGVFERGGLADVRSLRRDAHDPDGSCLLHGRGYCFSKTTVSGCYGSEKASG